MTAPPEWLPWLNEPTPVRCAACLRTVPMTVDDSNLCVPCDALIYP